MLLERLMGLLVTPRKYGDGFEAEIPNLEKVQVRPIEEGQKKKSGNPSEREKIVVNYRHQSPLQFRHQNSFHLDYHSSTIRLPDEKSFDSIELLIKRKLIKPGRSVCH